MSKRNIVNPDHYKTRGRLTPDDLAREKRKQTEARKTVMAAGPPRARKKAKSR